MRKFEKKKLEFHFRFVESCVKSKKKKVLQEMKIPSKIYSIVCIVKYNILVTCLLVCVNIFHIFYFRFVYSLNYIKRYLEYGCGFRCLSLGEPLDTFVWNVGFAPSPENIYW